jgi:hypothetical protein
MTPKELSRMNEAALASIAADYGVAVSADSMTKKQMIDLIIPAIERQSRIEAEENEENEDLILAEPVPEAPKKVEKTDKSKRYKIIIHDQEGPDNTPFVKVSVQGVMTTIPRNTEVVVGHAIKHVLDNATMTLFQFERGPDGTQRVVERNVRRFPFSVVDVL